MPRFANLKGSMNTFDNNKPVLSSSDRIRNKKSKYIYAAAKKKFQSKRRCNGKNIKYYKKGTVRSVTNYKLQQDLAIGNALCEDCNGRGNLCGTIHKSNLQRVIMGNNIVSEFQGTGIVLINFFEDPPYSQQVSLPIIQSDISGVWGGSTTDISKSIIGPNTISDNGVPMPYGYINNLIHIPRNLDGSGIEIDPYNILFPDDNCNYYNHQKNNNLKTTIVIRGSFNLDRLNNPDYISKCPGPRSDSLINTFLVIWLPKIDDSAPISHLTYGIIKKICCVGEKIISKSSDYNAAIIDIFVELFMITDYNDLNLLVNTQPLSLPNGTYQWPCPTDPYFCDSMPPFSAPFFYIFLPKFQPGSQTTDETIESIRIFQGTCEDNQTTGNKTKQNYLSCIDDGTKKIKFT